MTKEKFYEILGNMDEEFIQEAHTSVEADDEVQVNVYTSVEMNEDIQINAVMKKYKGTTINWFKKGMLIACACVLVLTLGIGVPQYLKSMGNGGSFWGNKDGTILAEHRNEITPDIESHILEQLQNYTEVKKTYVLLFNTWFLSDELTDFSQVVTDEIFYVVPGDRENPSAPHTYTIYTVNEAGEIEWDTSAYSEKEDTQPSEFFGLTYEVIEKALSGIEYEDYIITCSQSIRTVIVWVRSESGDVFLTYPSRPDFVGLEKGGIYTLKEMQEILTEVYENN